LRESVSIVNDVALFRVAACAQVSSAWRARRAALSGAGRGSQDTDAGVDVPSAFGVDHNFATAVLREDFVARSSGRLWSMWPVPDRLQPRLVILGGVVVTLAMAAVISIGVPRAR